MIGIVVVSHDNIAKEMIAVTKKILPDAEGLIGVPIDSDLSVDTNRQRIVEAISDVYNGDGVLLLSDKIGRASCRERV